GDLAGVGGHLDLIRQNDTGNAIAIRTSALGKRNKRAVRRGASQDGPLLHRSAASQSQSILLPSLGLENNAAVVVVGDADVRHREPPSFASRADPMPPLAPPSAGQR